MSALSRIADFAAGSGTGAFAGIARVDVVTGLRERVADPKKIDTSAVNLCGPAALFYCLLGDDPERYVRYVIDLYTTGRANLGSLQVSPGSDCRNCRPDRSQIAPIDWIALASLRDSENTILDFESVNDGAAGITMPHSLAAWFTACGYSQVRNDTNVFITKGRSELDTVHQLRLQARRVCLFINDNMLYSNRNTNRSFAPNHWVVVESTAGVTGSTISLRVFSWGQLFTVPPTGSLEIGPFSRNFYGFVAAVVPARR